MTIFGFTISAGVFWIVVACIFAVLEGITLGFITIWFAGGALTAALASLSNVNFGIQIIIFILVSVGMMIISRPMLKRNIERESSQTNVEAVLNKEGIVTEDIKPFKVGAVRVNGLIWSAISNDRISIKKNEVVTIKKVEGVKVIVDKVERG